MSTDSFAECIFSLRDGVEGCFITIRLNVIFLRAHAISPRHVDMTEYYHFYYCRRGQSCRRCCGLSVTLCSTTFFFGLFVVCLGNIVIACVWVFSGGEKQSFPVDICGVQPSLSSVFLFARPSSCGRDITRGSGMVGSSSSQAWIGVCMYYVLIV